MMFARPLRALAVASALATALVLTACGSGTGTSSSSSGSAASSDAVAVPSVDVSKASGTVKFLAQSAGSGTEPFDAVIKAFEAENPNITVEAEYVPLGTTYAETLRTRLRSGNVPDVFYVTPGAGGLASVGPLADAGYVGDLSAQSWANTVVPVNSKSLYWSGNQLLAVPIDVVPIAQMYNTDALAGAKPATTMNDLLAQCPTVAAAGKNVLSLAGVNPQNAGLLATAVAANTVLQGTPDWNEQRTAGKTTFAGTTGWQQALQTILDMKAAQCFPEGAEGADFDFAAPALANGDALSWVIPAGSASALQGINPDVKVVAYPLPGDSASSTVMYASPSDALAMSSTASNQAGAVAFLDFFATGGGSKAYADATGNLPITNGVTDPSNAPTLAGIETLLNDPTKLFPLIQLGWEKPAVYETLGKGVQALLTGQQSVNDVLTAMDTAWDK